jgi:hypothetical protein
VKAVDQRLPAAQYSGGAERDLDTLCETAERSTIRHESSEMARSAQRDFRNATLGRLRVTLQ